MKYLAILIFVSLAFTSSGQHNWDGKNWDKKSIGFGCGFSGSMTDAVTHATVLLADRDYQTIRKLLNSKKTNYQFLSVLVLEQLVQQKEISLTIEEYSRIAELKMSQRKVPVCSGCTYFDEQPLSALLRKKNKHPIYASGVSWFNRYYKQSKQTN